MSSWDGRSSVDLNAGSDEEEEGIDGRRLNFTHNLNLGNSHRMDVERDSGLPSSGKGTSSYGDLDLSDSEERGVYDYFPTEESIKRNDFIKISHTENPEYDEAVEVDDESPRSDTSSTNEYNVTNPLEEEGTEMRTFSRDIHRALYANCSRNEIPDSILKNDSDDEEYCMTSALQQRKTMSKDCTVTVRTNVDDAVCFSSFSRPYGTFSQSQEEAECGGPWPPFGHKNQLEKVGDSINNLLESTHHGSSELLDDAKKKKNLKKKKGSKDDADDRVSGSKTRKSPMHHDENGNPIDITPGYRSMRELTPKQTEGSVFSSKKHSNYGIYSQLSKDITDLETFPFSGQSIKDLEDGASNSDRKKIRKKAQHKEPTKLAEDIPNYVGNLADVDDLVKFINTHDISEKQLKKKLSRKSSPSSESALKAEKLGKKSKEKKSKGGQADVTSDTPIVLPATAETRESQANSSLEETAQQSGEEDILQEVVVHCPLALSETHTADLEKVPKAETCQCKQVMGNSGDKAAPASVVQSPDPPQSVHLKPKKVEAKGGLPKDINTPQEKANSSKSPPLIKKEVEHKDKNKTKTKEKEKPGEVLSTFAENKKQKGKNGKPDGQLKNNKKIESKNDIIPDSKPGNMVKSEYVPNVVLNALDNDLAINENKDYIFTDIDGLPPVEQEFTLVSKKKKRPVVKEVIPDFHRPKNGPKEYRGFPPPRSATPPPTSVLKKEQGQDLNPSSFPVLGKKANVSKVSQTFREGRRNSFGDVPVDTSTELRSQDDSDIESVKSLPAAKGGSLSDVVSSRFRVSYAKMVAAPKPPHSPASLTSGEHSEIDMQSETACAKKPTVWKGSPTERRHSIGSSPEDTKQESSPKLSQRSRQKSGSQEFLLSDCVKGEVDVSVSPVATQASSVSVSEVKHVSSSSNRNVSGETLASDGPEILKSEGKPMKPSDTPSIPTITVTLDSSKVDANNLVLKVNNHHNGPKKVPLNGPLNGPQNRPPNGPQRTMKTEVPICTDRSRSHHSVSSSSISKDQRGKPLSALTHVSNNNKKNNKSVIFLDKRFSDAPGDLDITFGFDSNIDHNAEGASNSEMVVDTMAESIRQESVSCVENSNHNQIEPQSVALPKDIATKSEPSIAATATISSSSAQHPSPASVPNSSSGHSVALPHRATSNGNTLSKASKAQVSGLNGVVLPKTQGYRQSQGSEVLRTEQPVPVERKAPAVAKDKTKTVLVFYGEGIVVKTDHPGVSIDSRDAAHTPASQRKGQLTFSHDASGSEGKFNVSEAVKFLKQEWDRVLEQKDRNPHQVQFYKSQ